LRSDAAIRGTSLANDQKLEQEESK